MGLLGLPSTILGFFARRILGLLRRKILGLLCIIWIFGLPFELILFRPNPLGLMGGLEGIQQVVTMALMIFPLNLLILATLLTGLYNLFVGQNRTLDKGILLIGIILSAIGLFQLYSLVRSYDPTKIQDFQISLLAFAAPLLVFLSGIWSIETAKRYLSVITVGKEPIPYFSNIRILLTAVIIVMLIVINYSIILGRPLISLT